MRAKLPKIYSHELVDVIFEQPYYRIANLVDAGIAGRQAASRYLKAFAAIGVLREQTFGKEKLFVHLCKQSLRLGEALRRRLLGQPVEDRLGSAVLPVLATLLRKLMV